MVQDRLHRTPGVYRLVVCEECGHVQLGSRLTERQLRAAYPPYYMAKGLVPRRPHTLRGRLMSRLIPRRMEAGRVNLIGRFAVLAPGVRLLDVGCGNGDFVEAACRLSGADATGLEPDGDCVQRARAQGREVRHGTLLDRRSWRQEEFELLTMWHVLEHTADPIQELLAAREALKPGGHLFVVVPNHGGLGARIFGQAWFGLDIPRHLQQFNPASLLLAAERAGFIPLEVRTILEFSMIAGSVHNLFGRRWCDDLESNLYKWIALQACFMPLDWVANLFGRGDCLLLVARKPDD